jgi:hypothetical protein
MVREPIGDIESLSWVKSVCRDRIAVEIIKDYGLNQTEIRWFWHINSATNFEAVSSKVVRKELNG